MANWYYFTVSYLIKILKPKTTCYELKNKEKNHARNDLRRCSDWRGTCWRASGGFSEPSDAARFGAALRKGEF